MRHTNFLGFLHVIFHVCLVCVYSQQTFHSDIQTVSAGWDKYLISYEEVVATWQTEEELGRLVETREEEECLLRLRQVV